MNVYALWGIKNSPGLTDPRKIALGTRLLTADYHETKVIMILTDFHWALLIVNGILKLEQHFQQIPTWTL